MCFPKTIFPKWLLGQMKTNFIGPTWSNFRLLKFIYSEKATEFYEISTVDLSYVVQVKNKVEILQKFVAFSEYMNFTFIFSKYFCPIVCLISPTKPLWCFRQGLKYASQHYDQKLCCDTFCLIKNKNLI